MVIKWKEDSDVIECVVMDLDEALSLVRIAKAIQDSPVAQGILESNLNVPSDMKYIERWASGN